MIVQMEYHSDSIVKGMGDQRFKKIVSKTEVAV